MPHERGSFYQQQVATLAADISRLRERTPIFIIAELTTFASAVLGVVAYVLWGGGAVALVVAAAMLAAYLAIRHKDLQTTQLAEHQEDLRSVYEKELAYLNGDFTPFPTGEGHIDPHHEYTFDLDIFGRESLFNRIDRTITTGGSDFLAHELAGMHPKSAAETAERRKAIGELAGQEGLRTRFLSLGQRKHIDTAEIQETLKSIQKMQIAPFYGGRLAHAVALLAIIAYLCVIAAATVGLVGSGLAIAWGVAQFFIVTALCSRPIHMMSKMVSRMHKQLKAYADLMVIVSEAPLESKENADIIHCLTDNDAHAIASFNELKAILDRLDRRGNVMGLIIFNTFLLYDFFITRQFLCWQSRYMAHVGEWMAAMSHFDALVSMATFRYNEPSATEADIVEADKMVYTARELRHPFLGEKAVSNDFSIEDAHYYIITGANMAGKSTFLRAIGINYVLARCGMPVFAQHFRASIFALFSSMRTTDDLAHGISYFNAELLRLQQLIEACKQNGHTLIILDEILKGTNSLDKLNGSRLFLESVASLPVTGIIATHDLELSKMEEARPERFHNYCFEIQLADKITYTYKITKGVARNQNATFLLKGILEQVR